MLDPRLSHFVAVVRCGSFTAAAQSVGVTQSAVTKSVADLERQLGQELFHRTARGARLTEQGHVIAERATRLLEDAREFFQGSKGPSRGFAGPLRVGVCPSSLEACLVDPVARFQGLHPGVRFEIIGASFTRMIQYLQNGAVDVVIGFDAAFSEWPGIHREPIGTIQIIPFARRGHPLSGRQTPVAEELAHFDFVSPSDSSPYSDVIRKVCDSPSVKWRERLHLIDNFAIAQQLVASSDAIGLAVPMQMALPAFEREFVVLGDDTISEAASICCATQERWEPSRAVRAFTSVVRQAFFEVVPRREPWTEVASGLSPAAAAGPRELRAR